MGCSSRWIVVWMLHRKLCSFGFHEPTNVNVWLPDQWKLFNLAADQKVAQTYLLPGSSFCLSPRFLFVTPSGSSISFSSICWSLESIGAIEMSRTARNWPQLFKCSFSRRKKFHTNLLTNRNIYERQFLHESSPRVICGFLFLLPVGGVCQRRRTRKMISNFSSRKSDIFKFTLLAKLRKRSWPEHFQRSENCFQNFTVKMATFSDCHCQAPGKTEYEVFHHGKIVISLPIKQHPYTNNCPVHLAKSTRE